ncbi:MAG: serine--tRNA ligase [Patescibacteria group bacterium]
MLDITFIRENPDIVRAAITNKNREGIDLDRVLVLADERKKLAGEISDLNQKKNENAKKFGGGLDDATKAEVLAEGTRIKEATALLEETYQTLEKELVSILVKIPNIPSADTPVGPDESSNQILRTWGEKPQFSFEPKAHWDIGKNLEIIDSEKAADVSGARFTYLKGDLALMQYALADFTIKTLTSRETLSQIAKEANLQIDVQPFVPIIPPLMMRSSVMNRMARLDPIDERYYFEKDDLVFIGSAEHTLGPIHMDEVIPEAQLPLRYFAYTAAFRREAGAAGKDTRGILRQHQFDKVEMETFCLPEHSYAEQDFLVAIQEYLIRQLKIPYQVIICSTGDQGDADHRHIDLECYMPGQGTYRETHSSDLMQGYQSRRLNTRVKRADGTVETVHMNDATAFAMGRTLIAILENYQNEDGSVTIPEVLRSYMGKDKIDLPTGRQGR